MPTNPLIITQNRSGLNPPNILNGDNKLSLNYFVLLWVLYIIASVVLRPYKQLDTLGVMYKSSME